MSQETYAEDFSSASHEEAIMGSVVPSSMKEESTTISNVVQPSPRGASLEQESRSAAVPSTLPAPPTLAEQTLVQPGAVTHTSVTVMAPPSVNIVMSRPPKSLAAAIVLAFFFGPLGLLYASVPAAIVMFGVTLVCLPLSFFLFGIPSLLAWIGCVVWAAVAVNNQNEAILTGVHRAAA